MDLTPRLSTEIRDSLVAYLDNELDDDETAKIDHLLTRNAVARHEVEALTRVWDLLDVLPKVSASREFSEKTLATIRFQPASITKPIESFAWFEAIKTWLQRGLAAIVIASLAYAGFQVSQRLVPDRNRQLLEELPLIERLDLYREAGSSEFVKELRASHLMEDVGHAPANE